MVIGDHKDGDGGERRMREKSVANLLGGGFRKISWSLMVTGN